MKKRTINACPEPQPVPGPPPLATASSLKQTVLGPTTDSREEWSDYLHHADLLFSDMWEYMGPRTLERISRKEFVDDLDNLKPKKDTSQLVIATTSG